MGVVNIPQDEPASVFEHLVAQFVQSFESALHLSLGEADLTPLGLPAFQVAVIALVEDALKVGAEAHEPAVVSMEVPVAV